MCRWLVVVTIQALRQAFCGRGREIGCTCVQYCVFDTFLLSREQQSHACGSNCTTTVSYLDSAQIDPTGARHKQAVCHIGHTAGKSLQVQLSLGALMSELCGALQQILLHKHTLGKKW